MRKTFFTMLIALLAIGFQSFSQQVYFNGKTNTDSIVVGQPFDYQLTLTIPKDYYVEWQQYGDTLNKSIEVIKAGDVETTPINNSNVLMTQHLTLTSFDTGYVYVPEISVTYAASVRDSIRRTLRTDEKELYVSTIAVDTTQAFRPIKDVMRQGVTAKEVLPWAGVAVVLAGIAFLIYYLSKKKKNKVVVKEEKPKPTIPAIITAREKLAEVRANEAWKTSEVKEYYTNITDIAREYLEGQFDIDAVEMTSDEIIESVKALNINERTFEKFRDTLVTADFVKFAKANPTAEQNERAFTDINGFVEDTFVFFQEEEMRKAEEEKNRKKAEKTELNNQENTEVTK